MDMQKEMEARHRNDMATMAKQHQETMKEMRTAISNIKIPRPSKYAIFDLNITTLGTRVKRHG